MGVIPSSIRVPRLLASIIRSQYRGSEVSDDTIPYRGIWLITKKINRVNCTPNVRFQKLFPVSMRTRSRERTPVHINFWLKGTLVSGEATSGRRGVKGLIKSRKRTVNGLVFGVINGSVISRMRDRVQGLLTPTHCDGPLPGQCNERKRNRAGTRDQPKERGSKTKSIEGRKKGRGRRPSGEEQGESEVEDEVCLLSTSPG